jgi:hypothetical protein
MKIRFKGVEWIAINMDKLEALVNAKMNFRVSSKVQIFKDYYNEICLTAVRPTRYDYGRTICFFLANGLHVTERTSN